MVLVEAVAVRLEVPLGHTCKANMHTRTQHSAWQLVASDKLVAVAVDVVLMLARREDVVGGVTLSAARQLLLHHASGGGDIGLGGDVRGGS